MSQELQAREKMEVATDAEQTRPRPVFVPAVDITESEERLTVMADMPGVEIDGLTIDLKEDVLTIHGQVSDSAGENRNTIYREYNVGDYQRQFTLSNAIDQEKIEARLKDGVLTLVLPKIEKPKPRKIEIRTD